MRIITDWNLNWGWLDIKTKWTTRNDWLLRIHIICNDLHPHFIWLRNRVLEANKQLKKWCAKFLSDEAFLTRVNSHTGSLGYVLLNTTSYLISYARVMESRSTRIRVRRYVNKCRPISFKKSLILNCPSWTSGFDFGTKMAGEHGSRYLEID